MHERGDRRPAPYAMTVVVMGYRNEATIADAVASVLDQQTDAAVEVVVVTSGGDRSADIVRRKYPDIKVIESQVRLLPGGARNAGVDAASGEVVAFLAADCIAEPGWVAGRLAAHRRFDAVASALTIWPPQRPAAWAAHDDLFHQRLPGRPAGVVASPDDGAGHGLSYRREVLDQLGPFDDSVLIGEDTLAARRLLQLGIRIWFEPGVRTAHRGPHNLVQLLREEWRRHQRGSELRVRDLPPITLRRALRDAPGRWARGMRVRAGLAWGYGRGQRIRVLVAVPWWALARAVALTSWYRTRVRASAPLAMEATRSG